MPAALQEGGEVAVAEAPKPLQEGGEVTTTPAPAAPLQTGGEVKPTTPALKPIVPKAGLLDVQPGEDWSKEPWWQRPISSFIPKPAVLKPTVATPTEEAAAQAQKPLQEGGEVSAEAPAQAPAVPQPEQIEALKKQYGNAQDTFISGAKQPQNVDTDEAHTQAVMSLLKDKKYDPDTGQWVARLLGAGASAIWHSPEMIGQLAKFGITTGQLVGIAEKVATGQPLSYQDSAVMRTFAAGLESSDESVVELAENMRNWVS